MSSFVANHFNTISEIQRKNISIRYHIITRAINRTFWMSSNDSQHSFYVGSYGRGTAISASDVDILVELPRMEYDRFNQNIGNSQSRLLQAVRGALISAYPRSEIRADGQIVKINFSDGIYFEILPAFTKVDLWGNSVNGFDYPDSNVGGRWRSTDPKVEQKAVKERNRVSNGLFNATCQHIRYIHSEYFSSYHLAGVVVDSFVYSAMGDWRFLKSNESSEDNSGDFEKILLERFRSATLFGIWNLQAPGSGQLIDGSQSLDCLHKVLQYMVG